jgi:hypothetical protein
VPREAESLASPSLSAIATAVIAGNDTGALTDSYRAGPIGAASMMALGSILIVRLPPQAHGDDATDPDPHTQLTSPEDFAVRPSEAK